MDGVLGSKSATIAMLMPNLAVPLQCRWCLPSAHGAPSWSKEMLPWPLGTLPSFQVLIYPMLDATASAASYEEFATGYGFSSEKSRWYFDQYLPPGVDRRTPRASPLFDRGLGKLPATLVVTAQCDPLLDEGEHHSKNLREAGVKVELRRYSGMIHGFFQMTGALEGSRQLHRELGDWMRTHTEQARRANQ